MTIARDLINDYTGEILRRTKVVQTDSGNYFSIKQPNDEEKGALLDDLMEELQKFFK